MFVVEEEVSSWSWFEGELEEGDEEESMEERRSIIGEMATLKAVHSLRGVMRPAETVSSMNLLAPRVWRRVR